PPPQVGWQRRVQVAGEHRGRAGQVAPGAADRYRIDVDGIQRGFGYGGGDDRTDGTAAAAEINDDRAPARRIPDLSLVASMRCRRARERGGAAGEQLSTTPRHEDAGIDGQA